MTTAKYRDIGQAIDDSVLLWRRLKGITGRAISDDKGRANGHTSQAQRRALNRIGLAKLEDYRPIQIGHVTAIRGQCQLIVNNPEAPIAQRMRATLGFGSMNLILNDLDVAITVDPEPIRQAIETAPFKQHTGEQLLGKMTTLEQPTKVQLLGRG